MTYKHIKDCWEAIENCKSLSKLKELFWEFPRWYGDWDYEINEEDKIITVINNYYIEQIDEDGHDEREYEFSQFEDINEYL